MNKNYFKMIFKYVLFCLGIAIMIAGYYANEEYKQRNGLDSSSGATQTSEKSE